MGDRGGGGGVGRQSSYLYLAQHTHTAHTHSHALHRRLRKPPAAPQHPQTLICTCPGGKWSSDEKSPLFIKKKTLEPETSEWARRRVLASNGQTGGGVCAQGVTRPLCPQPLSFDGGSRLSILLTLLLLAALLLSIQTRACSEDNRGGQADS